MGAIINRGQLAGSRRPGIDARVSYELSKLIRSIPNISRGITFPPGGQFGDMHFFTGESSDGNQTNNWYIKRPDEGWQSMNATNLVPENFQTGTIPSGVKVADYLALLGGVMAGPITFHESQSIPPEMLADGTIPPGVIVSGALPITGGTLSGKLGLSHHDITAIDTLVGFDSDLFIDMGVDGTITISANDSIVITAPEVDIDTLVSLAIQVLDLHVTNDITLDDDMVLAAGSVLTWATDTNLYRSSANVLKTDDTFIAANIATGANIDQDVRSGAAPVLLGTNFQSYNIVCDDDEVIVSNGEVVYA